MLWYFKIVWYISDRIKCHDGFYGQTCERRCSGHCIANRCDINNGNCECNRGYGGNPCTECPPNCYNSKCDHRLHCISCISGYYGDFCNQTCSEHCKNPCDRDGKCTCYDGYGGHPCEPCPSNCDGTGCDDQLHCLNCKPGFYSDFCNQTCSDHCADNRCEKDGRCRCNVGYGGHPCEACPKNCGDTGCNGQLICHECDPGFYGDYCYLTCSTNCNGTCNRDGSCTCKKGFVGFGCCPENCEGCCNDKTFECAACKEGYYSRFCNETCPDNCKYGCTREGLKCKDCKEGHWGVSCQHRCPQQCKSPCDQESGTCQDKPGKGHLWEHKCILNKVYLRKV